MSAVLIKDNHLAWLAEHGDPIGVAIAAAPRSHALPAQRSRLRSTRWINSIALEHAGPISVFVDNLGPEALTEAIRRRDARAPEVLLEASGGITLATVRDLAETGVDRISIGALTHSAPALDIEPTSRPILRLLQVIGGMSDSSRFRARTPTRERPRKLQRRERVLLSLSLTASSSTRKASADDRRREYPFAPTPARRPRRVRPAR